MESNQKSGLQSSTTTPLIHTDKIDAAPAPPGWPTTPRRVELSWLAILSNGLLDVMLLACSMAFLAFALVVNTYDQEATGDCPKTKSMLEDATKYVSVRRTVQASGADRKLRLGTDGISHPLRIRHRASGPCHSSLAAGDRRACRCP